MSPWTHAIPLRSDEWLRLTVISSRKVQSLEETVAEILADYVERMG